MPRKLRQLRADLRRLGALITTLVGSHEKWKHPLVTHLSKTSMYNLLGRMAMTPSPIRKKISAHSPEQFGRRKRLSDSGGNHERAALLDGDRMVG